MSKPDWKQIAEAAADDVLDLRQQLDRALADVAGLVTYSPTAELRHALSGEFVFLEARQCSACHFDFPDEDCEVCGGSVEYTESVTVPWTTIKEIIRSYCENQAKKLRSERPEAFMKRLESRILEERAAYEREHFDRYSPAVARMGEDARRLRGEVDDA